MVKWTNIWFTLGQKMKAMPPLQTPETTGVLNLCQITKIEILPHNNPRIV